MIRKMQALSELRELNEAEIAQVSGGKASFKGNSGMLDTDGQGGPDIRTGQNNGNNKGPLH